MKSSLARFAFLLCFFGSSLAIAQDASVKAQGLLDEVKSNEMALMATTGLSTSQFQTDTQGFAYARSVHADSFVELVKDNPGLLLDKELLKAWFALEVSTKPEYQLPLKELIGLTFLQFDNSEVALDYMEKNGFAKYLSNFDLGRSDWKHFSREQSLLWLSEMTDNFASKEPEKRHRAWQLLQLYRSPKLQGYSKKSFFDNITGKILSSVDRDAKFLFVQEVLSQKQNLGLNKTALPFNLVVHWALENIPFSDWKQTQLNLLGKLLRAMDSVTGTQVVVQWLSRKPAIAKEFVPVLDISTPDSFSIEDDQGLPLLEQLLHYSHEYRSVFYQAVHSTQVKSWTMPVIEFAFQKGSPYPRTFEIKNALTYSYVLQNPKWFDWMNELSPLERRSILRDVVGFDALYHSQSESALELQKKIYEDIKSGLADQRVQTRDLSFFLQRAMKNATLKELIITEWTVEILEMGHQEATAVLVDQVFSDSSIDFERRKLWLEKVLSQELSSEALLTKLMEVYPVDSTFVSEMQQAQNQPELLAEIGRMALAEYLISGGGARCQNVF